MFSGWRLTGLAGAVVVALAAAAFALAPEPVEGARMAIRLTERTSLALFLPAFAASALVRLFPSAPTRWLRRNRRYLGVAFAVSHGVHLAAIITLAQLDFAVFLRLTNVVTYLGGGLAYGFILAMTLTSFDRPARLIGLRAWRLLHRTGIWYIWLSFALNFGKRVPISAAYLLPVALIALAALLRLTGGFRSGKRDDEGVSPPADPVEPRA